VTNNYVYYIDRVDHKRLKALEVKCNSYLRSGKAQFEEVTEDFEDMEEETYNEITKLKEKLKNQQDYINLIKTFMTDTYKNNTKLFKDFYLLDKKSKDID